SWLTRYGRWREAMIEGAAGPGEPATGQRLYALLGRRCWLAFVFQSEDQNPLQSTHVDQLKTERSGAGGVQAFGRVALGQSYQALALAQLGPREGCIQQPLGKLADVRTEGPGLADEAVWCAHGVRGALGWVVIRIGGAAALRPPWMDLDERSGFVELDQIAIAAHLQLG